MCGDFERVTVAFYSALVVVVVIVVVGVVVVVVVVVEYRPPKWPVFLQRCFDCYMAPEPLNKANVLQNKISVP